MNYEIIIKNIPDDSTQEDIEQIIDDIKEPVVRYFVRKEGTGLDWLPDSDIQVFTREYV